MLNERDILIGRLIEVMKLNGCTDEAIETTIKQSVALEELNKNERFKNLSRESRKLIIRDLLSEYSTCGLSIIRGYYRETCINYKNNCYDEYLVENFDYNYFHNYRYIIEDYEYYLEERMV